MRSIRRRLFLTLFVLWTTVWVAVGLTTYERSGHEIGELMDAQLAQTANVLRPTTLVRHPRALLADPQSIAPLGHPHEAEISFQLWRHDELLARFGGAPESPLGLKMGFSDHWAAGAHWRVFGVPGQDPADMLYVGQRYSVRDELTRDLTLTALRPVLWSLPVSILLIWMAISDGLRPIRDLTDDIAQRSPEQLEPIPSTRVPSEIRPLADAVSGLMGRLERALSAERYLAADASHELRTPFAAIRAHAQIALRSQDPGERADALRRLMQGIDRASRLISQLLTLSRLGAATQDGEAHVGSLTKAVGAVLEDQREAARTKGIGLEASVPSDDPCLVSVPASALSILIGNLVDNALKFSPQATAVSLLLHPEPHAYRLDVTDSGPGIAAADRSRVFDRFYRPPGQSESGAGLGLAIVQRIGDLYGLDVSLHDRSPAPGLRVVVTFPKAG